MRCVYGRTGGQAYAVSLLFSCFFFLAMGLRCVRAWKFRCNSKAPNNFILLKTSASCLFLVPSACWAWRRQLEKEQEV